MHSKVLKPKFSSAVKCAAGIAKILVFFDNRLWQKIADNSTCEIL